MKKSRNCMGRQWLPKWVDREWKRFAKMGPKRDCSKNSTGHFDAYNGYHDKDNQLVS